jgi:nitroreductase
MEQIKMRRSIRKYLNKPVEDEKIMQLIESARLAPSGSNTEPWRFIIVKSEWMRKKLAEAANNQKWMLSAPDFIVCVADSSARMNADAKLKLDENSPQEAVKQIIRDTSIAIEHMILEATSLGLGSCWVSWFTQNQIRPILSIPPDKYVVGIVTVGYADEKPTARPRKKIEEIVRYEHW